MHTEYWSECHTTNVSNYTQNLSVPCHFDSSSSLMPPCVLEHSLIGITALCQQAAGAYLMSLKPIEINVQVPMGSLGPCSDF